MGGMAGMAGAFTNIPRDHSCDVVVRDVQKGLLVHLGGKYRPHTLRHKYRRTPKQRRGKVRVVEGDGAIVKRVGYVQSHDVKALRKIDDEIVASDVDQDKRKDDNQGYYCSSAAALLVSVTYDLLKQVRMHSEVCSHRYCIDDDQKHGLHDLPTHQEQYVAVVGLNRRRCYRVGPGCARSHHQ